MLLCVLLFYCLDHLFYCFIVWTICPFILIECHTWHCSILLALESVLSGNLSALLSSLCFICTLCCYIPTCFLRACLEALAGEHSTPLTGDWSSSVGTVVLWPSGSCRRDTCGVVREQGTRTYPVTSAESTLWPLGDRCCNQITLTASKCLLKPQRALKTQARDLSCSWIVYSISV